MVSVSFSMLNMYISNLMISGPDYLLCCAEGPKSCHINLISTQLVKMPQQHTSGCNAFWQCSEVQFIARTSFCYNLDNSHLLHLTEVNRPTERGKKKKKPTFSFQMPVPVGKTIFLQTCLEFDVSGSSAVLSRWYLMGDGTCDSGTFAKGAVVWQGTQITTW